MSGNGYYPLIRFDPPAPATLENEELMYRWQEHSHQKFADPNVKMDSVVNLDRVLALVGTRKNKLIGLDAYTEDRPNRDVELVSKGIPTTWEKFAEFARTLPKAETYNVT